MVQQLSLFGITTQSQHSLLIASLSSLVGQTRSQKYENLTVLAKPTTIIKFEPNSTKQQYEQYKIQLKSKIDENFSDIESLREWGLQVYDIPNQTVQNSSSTKKKLNVNSQNFLESYIILNKGDKLDDILKELGYERETSYRIKGERFYYGNITIELFQILIYVENEWILLDNSIMVKTFINIAKITDLENINKSTQELVNLKMELTGLVDLSVPDKNNLDSRIGLNFRK
ncbi:hypothetical protein WICMUC_005947 [Wickerhamomyces mucosus]|uniref:Mediator of RNA polymerase II transcription subunit 18 n=1 Tax=Wickerhamomyces mucosus TaxID=1378264 RepID=A0A9P8T2A0_9ASCO|nr:hypothetical protein WICMUC_005947 [Wickerhamomyces mucosus]